MSANSLGTSLEKFFREYLPNLRGTSPHTLRSYRDPLLLFLRHLSAQTGKSIDLLDLPDWTAEQVISFLDALEKNRHNGIATRNSRLPAFHTFVRFLTFDHPEKLAELQRVLGFPSSEGLVPAWSSISIKRKWRHS
jgi:site-specific recombinase XerD